jgi:ElaB/YqjD/DUF883 family membrane-anchored ribosome-binding protein
MNPNENDLTRDEPLPGQFQPREEETPMYREHATTAGVGATGREQFRRATQEVSTQMSQTWDQTKEKANRALVRTEDFMRENPVPTILGALGLGIAIGLAIRFIAPGERKHEVEVKSPVGTFNWSLLSLPFLWPFLKSARKKYEESADVVADAVKDGVKRLKKMDVERYSKPIRRRWKAWTR